MPTLANIAGAGFVPKPCDGVDITGLLRSQSPLQRDTLYWHYPHYSDQGGKPCSAIREGDWKLIESFEEDHIELYNLALDPGEQYDFSSSFAPRAEDLHMKLQDWRRQVNAAMPRPNPDSNPSLAELSRGPAGCSWLPSAQCRED
jgi:arylsulfatase A-like enzyme